MKIVVKNHKKNWFFIVIGLCVFSLSIISACVSTEPSLPAIAMFTAGGRVEGLNFKSNHKQGFTDHSGVFYYNEGDTVAFFLGDIPIGNPINDMTTDKNDFSPFDLVNDTDSSITQKNTIINISRLLQSLDIDGDYKNGITITSEIRSLMTGITITFDVSDTEFESDAGIVTLFNRLNSSNIYTDNRTLISYSDAKANLIAGMIKDPDTKPPAVLINLGDDWVCGTQSGYDVLHRYTQIYGYASLLAGRFDVLFDTSWTNPLLELDTLERVYETFVPYNIGVPSATAESMVNDKTGGDNTLLTKLLTPLNLDEDNNDLNIGQLDAVEKLLDKNETSFVNIFTLTIGFNDVFRVLLTKDEASGEYTTNLTTTSSDATAVESNIETIVNNLKAYPDSFVFISNLPDLDNIGVLFSKSDINAHTSFAEGDCALPSMADTSYLGLPAFKKLGTDGKLYDKTSSCADLDAAIALIGEEDILTEAEATPIQDKISAINVKIESLVNNIDNDNVFLVDVNKLFNDIEDGQKNMTVTDSDGTEKPIELNTHFGGGVYSLDGLTLSITGYSLVANLFNAGIHSALENNLLNVAEVPENTIEKLVGDDETLDVVVENAYELDPYQDMDQDGFIVGTSLNNRADTYFLGLIDCDDDENGVIAPFDSDTGCSDQ